MVNVSWGNQGAQAKTGHIYNFFFEDWSWSILMPKISAESLLFTVLKITICIEKILQKMVKNKEKIRGSSICTFSFSSSLKRNLYSQTKPTTGGTTSPWSPRLRGSIQSNQISWMLHGSLCLQFKWREFLCCICPWG